MYGFIPYLSFLSTSYYNDLSLLHAATGLRPTAPIVLGVRNYYCLQYNQAGTITVQVDDEPTQQIRGPSLLITSPGHRYSFGNYEGWHHNFIAFRGKRVEQYIKTGLLPIERPLMRIRAGGEFMEQFERCVNALRVGGDRLNASHQLEGLLIKLHVPAEPLTELPHHEEIRQLATAMRDAPERDYSLGRRAADMYISEAHLRRLFRRLVGSAPARFLLKCRLSAASDRLASTREPIKQIAAEYQFESVHHFTKAFRKHYGVPPGQFRREMLGD